MITTRNSVEPETTTPTLYAARIRAGSPLTA
eukprot:CAMPEP_0180243848 /NCGR_PEP_ID=MMETSP0987-20121128/34069_1 /TAXON_ID=697907 /ORGANISM="non described non described, Strain CCMP2293" /LENGTH=30 /DNA_ID= /DNA_START= /DNA_END= /DNA_ORIENTATION=